ncbi:hypothetical protein J6590_048734 [Homalodisca vitripennis]|nr:hypothetical protein J6590_048734 [Homalodisca vitripennis]
MNGKWKSGWLCLATQTLLTTPHSVMADFDKQYTFNIFDSLAVRPVGAYTAQVQLLFSVLFLSVFSSDGYPTRALPLGYT